MILGSTLAPNGAGQAVSFRRYGRLYYLDPGDHDYRVGDRVLVPTDTSTEVAECVWAPEQFSDGPDGIVIFKPYVLEHQGRAFVPVQPPRCRRTRPAC